MIHLKNIFLVAAGGAIGSAGRYATSWWINSSFQQPLFPWGTFTVNVVGCFIIGWVYGYSSRSPLFDADWRLFLATGVCGGFTTFSAFSNESFLLIRQHHYFTACLYIIGSLLLGMAATVAGYWVNR
jgi:fluoride exporter